METTSPDQVAKSRASGRIPKLFGAGVLVASLFAGADNAEALGLTTAAYAMAEGTRSLLRVRSFRARDSRSASKVKPVAGHTP